MKLRRARTESVLSLRKVPFYAVVALIPVCAAIAGLNRDLGQSDLQAITAGPSGLLLAVRSTATSEMLPTDFLPVQCRNPDDLGPGKLLVASRNLGDPQFAKAVILLVRYDAKGVLGLMLNRRTHVPLSRALESLKAAKDRADPVYLGGPVETPAVFALLKSQAKPEGAEHVFDGVYLIAAKSLFEQILSTRPDPGAFHVYLGYAGWSQEQLQQEVALGAWFIFPAEARSVFSADPDSLWPEMIRRTEMQFAQNKGHDRIGVWPAN